ncbi:MAG: hypothetical protein P8166_17585 [Candidatus Thiodiazotropha sp.]
MAKSQKRSNKEVRKPKAKKKPETSTSTTLLTKGMTTATNMPKGKS